MDSVSFADSLVVVDLGSQDDSRAIAREFTDRVFFQPGLSVPVCLQLGLRHLKTDWVLVLDPDSVVSSRLHQELEGVILSRPNVPGFYLPVHLQFQGKVLRYGHQKGLKQLRFFQRKEGPYKADALEWLPQELLKVDELNRHRVLEPPLLQSPYGSEQALFQAALAKGEQKALALIEEGKPPWWKTTLLALWWVPFQSFCQDFFLKLGFLDQVSGLTLAKAYSFQDYVKVSSYRTFVKEAKALDLF